MLVPSQPLKFGPEGENAHFQVQSAIFPASHTLPAEHAPLRAGSPRKQPIKHRATGVRSSRVCRCPRSPSPAGTNATACISLCRLFFHSFCFPFKKFVFIFTIPGSNFPSWVLNILSQAPTSSAEDTAHFHPSTLVPLPPARLDSGVRDSCVNCRTGVTPATNESPLDRGQVKLEMG